MSDKNTLQVTAQLYRVAEDFTARAGDRVMIVAGVCIGTYTGEPRQLAGAEPAAKGTPDKPSKYIARPKKHPKTRTPRPPEETEALRHEMRRRLCGEFRKQPDLTLTANEIGKLYGTAADMYHVRKVIAEMREDRIIGVRGAGRSASYTLLNSSICEARAEVISAGETEHAAE